MEKPNCALSNELNGWSGSGGLPEYSGVKELQGSPYPQLVDKLGNFI